MNNWILPDKRADMLHDSFQKTEERKDFLEKSRGPNYVLIDAVLWVTDIDILFTDESVNYRSLFKGSAGDELWNAASQLMEISSNGPLLEKIRGINWTGNPNHSVK